jgi:hypothetical protein
MGYFNLSTALQQLSNFGNN